MYYITSSEINIITFIVKYERAVAAASLTASPTTSPRLSPSIMSEEQLR